VEGGPSKLFMLPQKQLLSLLNGMQVTMVTYGSIPKVMIDVTVRAGNLNESADQVWLADLMGRLMKEGTTSRTSERVAEEAASMGGSVDITVGSDQTRIAGGVLS